MLINSDHPELSRETVTGMQEGVRERRACTEIPKIIKCVGIFLHAKKVRILASSFPREESHVEHTRRDEHSLFFSSLFFLLCHAQGHSLSNRCRVSLSDSKSIVG